VKIDRLRLEVEQEEAQAWVDQWTARHPAWRGARVAFRAGVIEVEAPIPLPAAGTLPVCTRWIAIAAPSGRLRFQLDGLSLRRGSGGSRLFAPLALRRIHRLLAGRSGWRAVPGGLELDAAAVAAAVIPAALQLRVTAVTVEPGRLTLEAG